MPDCAILAEHKTEAGVSAVMFVRELGCSHFDIYGFSTSTL